MDLGYHDVSPVMQGSIVSLVQRFITGLDESSQDVQAPLVVQRHFLSVAVDDLSGVDGAEDPLSPPFHVLDIHFFDVPEAHASGSGGVVQAGHQGGQVGRVAFEGVLKVLEGQHALEADRETVTIVPGMQWKIRNKERLRKTKQMEN